MDLISEVLSGVRVRAPLLAELRIGGAASIDMLEGPGSPFHYLVDGSAEISVGEERIALAPGDVALLPTWARHSLHCAGGGELRSILEIVETNGLPVWSMTDGLDKPLLIELGGQRPLTHVLSGNFVMDPQETGFLTQSLPAVIKFRADDRILHGPLRTTFELVLSELNRSEPGFSAVSARALELLFVQALRAWLLRSEHPSGWARGMAEPTIRRALEAIHAEPGRIWDLKALARIAGQSRSSFAAAFKRTTGETPFEHLRRVRMHRAASRLRDSGLSIPEIASEFGYSTGYAFARAFRAEMKVSASAYRRAHRVSP